mmetsp:Transcript_13159/g.18839  ORF Transcript_13159/g.18839 Transcript_13159/m.18839 type:complete len:170 (+) Transcript_13159:5-514(+)
MSLFQKFKMASKQNVEEKENLLANGAFMKYDKFPYPLRICCYGSSSILTPQHYLDQAHALGLTLAKRGHTCVNGAGMYGCMGAMNDGASEGDGHIVGVIHEMFIVDGSDWFEGSHKSFKEGKTVNTKKREILIASGDDLQDRKKKLVHNTDAIVVLPGGPGTWDEVRTI